MQGFAAIVFMSLLTEVKFHVHWALDSFSPRVFDRLVRRVQSRVLVDAPILESNRVRWYYGREAAGDFAALVRGNRLAARTVAEVFSANRGKCPDKSCLILWVHLQHLVNFESMVRARAGHTDNLSYMGFLSLIDACSSKRSELLVAARRALPESTKWPKSLFTVGIILAAGLFLYSVLSADQGSDEKLFS